MSDLRMPDLNKVIVAGRLTRDPELKYTTTGRPFCRMSVVNSRRYKGKDGGDWQEESTFIDVAVWGPFAESVGQKLSKGRPVLVEGRLRQAEWVDSQTGQKRTKLEINADRVTPLDWEDRGGGGSGGGGGYQQRPAQQQAAPAARDHDDEPPPEDDIPF